MGRLRGFHPQLEDAESLAPAFLGHTVGAGFYVVWLGQLVQFLDPSVRLGRGES